MAEERTRDAESQSVEPGSILSLEQTPPECLVGARGLGHMLVNTAVRGPALVEPTLESLTSCATWNKLPDFNEPQFPTREMGEQHS